jgi:hypothetical protein
MPPKWFTRLGPDPEKNRESWEVISPGYTKVLEKINQSLFDNQCELTHDEEGIPQPNVVLKMLVPVKGLTVYPGAYRTEEFTQGAALGICLGHNYGEPVIILQLWKVHKVRDALFGEQVVYSNEPEQYSWNVLNIDSNRLRTLLWYVAGKKMWHYLKSLGYI